MSAITIEANAEDAQLSAAATEFQVEIDLDGVGTIAASAGTASACLGAMTNGDVCAGAGLGAGSVSWTIGNSVTLGVGVGIGAAATGTVNSQSVALMVDFRFVTIGVSADVSPATDTWAEAWTDFAVSQTGW